VEAEEPAGEEETSSTEAGDVTETAAKLTEDSMSFSVALVTWTVAAAGVVETVLATLVATVMATSSAAA
jgi:hypothetical protein